MRWLYYIPHEWPEGERMFWADVMILPDDPAYDGKALWITVDAINEPANFTDEWFEWRQDRLAELGDAEFTMDGNMDLAVRATDFTREECLNWISRWMQSRRLDFSGWIRSTRESFAGRSDVADTVAAIKAHDHSK